MILGGDYKQITPDPPPPLTWGKSEKYTPLGYDLKVGRKIYGIKNVRLHKYIREKSNQSC